MLFQACSREYDWTEYLYFVGMFTLLLTNPIWVAKTRLCLQYDAHPSQHVQFYTGMLDCFYKTYKFEGIKGLYKASQSVELYCIIGKDVFY